jgi:hypothetical protein
LEPSQKKEIDRQIALEVGQITKSITSIDDLNERRMVCKFFGHAKPALLDKYKGTRTVYCPYCAEILAVGGSTRKQVYPEHATFVYEYMLDDSFLQYKHPKADK